MLCGKAPARGYALAYAPEAVYHSHRYTLREEYHRNKKIGLAMAQYRTRLTGAEADAEGWRMLHFVGGKLVRRRKYGELLRFYAHVCARFAGNRIGKSMVK